MAKKFYAVKRGYKTGVYDTWDACLKQVDGFKGAVYKSFPNPKDAWDFVRGISGTSSSKTPVAKPSPSPRPVGLEDLVSATAYTDGSYNNSEQTYSYGAIVIWQNKEYTFSQRFKNPALAAMRNVAGELEGAKKAMKFAFDNKIQYLTLYHDYQGIAAWALGTWKANLEATKAYQEFYKQISTKVNVHFEWVKGHSGDYYNDVADRLAASATFDLFEGEK
ncbi:viroplasmin family protein [[Acholeplasma] multilocale]|uniref:ribonuclease H1 domain-containing protein n=1 Tax=[Acholeplasma] multilocale TaxID=264638 RepID=UPI00047D816B|nr:ribonuclease H family protein [[Acholeplasma] multilocale]